MVSGTHKSGTHIPKIRSKLPDRALRKSLVNQFGTHYISAALHDIDTNEGQIVSGLISERSKTEPIGALMESVVLKPILTLFGRMLNSVKKGLEGIDWKTIISGPSSNVIEQLISILQRIVETTTNVSRLSASAIPKIINKLSKQFFTVSRKFFDYVKHLLGCSGPDSLNKKYESLAASEKQNNPNDTGYFTTGLKSIFEFIHDSFGSSDSLGDIDQSSQCEMKESASSDTPPTWEKVIEDNNRQPNTTRLTPRQISSLRQVEGEINNVSRLSGMTDTIGSSLWRLVTKCAKALLPVAETLYQKCQVACDNVGELLAAFSNSCRGHVSEALSKSKTKLNEFSLQLLSGINIVAEIASNGTELIDKGFSKIKDIIVDTLIWMIDSLSDWSETFTRPWSEFLMYLGGTQFWDWIFSIGKTTFGFFMFITITAFRWTIGFLNRVTNAITGFITKFIFKSANSIVNLLAGRFFFSGANDIGGNLDKSNLVSDVKSMIDAASTCQEIFNQRPEIFPKDTKSKLKRLVTMAKHIEESTKKLSSIRFTALKGNSDGSLSDAFDASGEACRLATEVWLSGQKNLEDISRVPNPTDPWDSIPEEQILNICSKYYGTDYLEMISNLTEVTQTLSDELQVVKSLLLEAIISNGQSDDSKLKSIQDEFDTDVKISRKRGRNVLPTYPPFAKRDSIYNHSMTSIVIREAVMNAFGKDANEDTVDIWAGILKPPTIQQNTSPSSSRPAKGKSWKRTYLIILLLTIAMGAIFAYWYFGPTRDQVTETIISPMQQSLAEAKAEFFDQNSNDSVRDALKELAQSGLFLDPETRDKSINDADINTENILNGVTLSLKGIRLRAKIGLDSHNQIIDFGSKSEDKYIEEVATEIYAKEFAESTSTWKIVTFFHDPYAKDRIKQLQEQIKAGEVQSKHFSFSVSESLASYPVNRTVYEAISSNTKFKTLDAKLDAYERAILASFSEFQELYATKLDELQFKEPSTQGEFTSISKKLEQMGALVHAIFPELSGNVTLKSILHSILLNASVVVSGYGLMLVLFMVIPVMIFGTWQVIKQRRNHLQELETDEEPIDEESDNESSEEELSEDESSEEFIGNNMRDNGSQQGYKSTQTFLDLVGSVLDDSDIVDSSNVFFWALTDLIGGPPNLAKQFLMLLIKSFLVRGGFVWNVVSVYSSITLGCDVGRIYSVAFYLPKMAQNAIENPSSMVIGSPYYGICNSCSKKKKVQYHCSAGSLCQNYGNMHKSPSITCSKCHVPHYCDQTCLNVHWHIHKKDHVHC